MFTNYSTNITPSDIPTYPAETSSACMLSTRPLLHQQPPTYHASNINNPTGACNYPGTTIVRERETVVVGSPPNTAGLQNNARYMQYGQPARYQLRECGELDSSRPKTQPIENWRFYPEKLSGALLPFGD